MFALVDLMLTIQPENFDWTMAMLSKVEKEQLPFAMANAINRTLEEAQTAIQNHMETTYTIRRPWVLQGIKIDNADRATKTTPRGIVHLDPARGFLSKFQDGDEKLPIGTSIAIPINARRTKADIVPQSQRPRSFHFTRGYSSIRTGATIWQGDKRTWLVQKKDGTGVIFQRKGKGKRSTNVVLFKLVPKAPTPANLDFYQVGEQTVHDRWLINAQGMLAYALKTAKP